MHHLVPVAGAGAGQGLRGPGAEEVSFNHMVSGIIAVALLVYLVVALIRAEDL